MDIDPLTSLTFPLKAKAGSSDHPVSNYTHIWADCPCFRCEGYKWGSQVDVQILTEEKSSKSAKRIDRELGALIEGTADHEVQHV